MSEKEFDRWDVLDRYLNEAISREGGIIDSTLEEIAFDEDDVDKEIIEASEPKKKRGRPKKVVEKIDISEIRGRIEEAMGRLNEYTRRKVNG